MERKIRKVLSNLHDDMIDALMKCQDLDELKAKMRSMLISINILLVEDRNSKRCSEERRGR